MQLTSGTLQFTTIAVAVLVTLGAVLLWNRVRGPRPLRALARVGLLTGSYAATALAVLISVNIAYGGLIVSVSDLFSDPNAVPMRHMRHHSPADFYVIPRAVPDCHPGPVPLPEHCLEEPPPGTERSAPYLRALGEPEARASSSGSRWPGWSTGGEPSGR